jgi:sulfotransferase
MKTFVLECGLPRSGSTVLTAILSQHPDIFASHNTSPLIDILINNQNIYQYQSQAAIANPNADQLTNITRRIIDNFYDTHKPVILDKQRGWSKNIPSVEILFGYKPKVIATIRDLPSIMASWLTLMLKNPGNQIDKYILQSGRKLNNETRMGEMWDNMVHDCYSGMAQLRNDVTEGQLLEINYDDLIDKPLEILNNINKFIGVAEFQYDINNIRNITIDDDLRAFGLGGMHTIRNQLSKTSSSPEEILGPDLFQKFTEIEKLYRK